MAYKFYRLFAFQSIIVDSGVEDGDEFGDDVLISGKGSHRTVLLFIKYCDKNDAVLADELADRLFCHG